MFKFVLGATGIGMELVAIVGYLGFSLPGSTAVGFVSGGLCFLAFYLAYATLNREEPKPDNQ